MGRRLLDWGCGWTNNSGKGMRGGSCVYTMLATGADIRVVDVGSKKCIGETVEKKVSRESH